MNEVAKMVPLATVESEFKCLIRTTLTDLHDEDGGAWGFVLGMCNACSSLSMFSPWTADLFNEMETERDGPDDTKEPTA